MNTAKIMLRKKLNFAGLYLGKEGWIGWTIHGSDIPCPGTYRYLEYLRETYLANRELTIKALDESS